MRDTIAKSPIEIAPQLVGVPSIIPFVFNDSPSRIQMACNHLTQMPVIAQPTVRGIQSGMERQFGAATYNVCMPEDGTILEVISRYRRGSDIMSIPDNEAQTIVIYENAHTHEIDMFELAGHHNEHPHFGFRYKKTEAFEQLAPKASFAKGTIFLQSPAVDADGNYNFGIEANVVGMTHPAVSEDGMVISRRMLPMYATTTYERREVEWGVRDIPLNIHGKGRPDVYKIFPEIGDYIDETGRVMVVRRDNRDAQNPKLTQQYFQDRVMGLVTKTRRGMSTVDNYFDKATHAKPGGKIVDIRVYHDDSISTGAPPQFEEQVRRYHKATVEFYARLLAFERKLRTNSRMRSKLNISPELNRLLKDGLAITNAHNRTNSERTQLLYRNNKMDEWRVEFVIEYKTYPTRGSKFTDLHGAKGVICHIEEPENMPRDELGNVADFIVDPRSTNSRMNTGRNFEQYFGAAGRDLTQRIMQALQLNAEDPSLLQKLQILDNTHDVTFEAQWNKILKYTKAVSPLNMYVMLTEGEYEGTRADFIHYAATRVFAQWFPIDAPTDYVEAGLACEEDPDIRPHLGHLTYVGYSGIRRTTKEKIRVGRQYMIALEKIGDDWSAVSMGKRQHFGVLSQLTNWDKYSKPTRANAVRDNGETEIRIKISYMGPMAAAEQLDRSHNPDTARLIADGILCAPTPSNIIQLIDRSQHHFGGSKPLLMLNHMFMCYGFQLVYKPYEDIHAGEIGPRQNDINIVKTEDVLTRSV